MSVTNDLLHNYQHVIDSLTLHHGSKGVFDVVVDGQRIYSKSETGRQAEPGEVLELFTELVGPDVARYAR